MEKIIIKFGDIEVNKERFHQHERPILLKYMDINEIVVSNKIFLVKEYLNVSLATKMLKK